MGTDKRKGKYGTDTKWVSAAFRERREGNYRNNATRRRNERLSGFLPYFRRCHQIKNPLCTEIFGNVRARYCPAFRHVPVGNFPPAPCLKADGPGEKQKGRQDHFLFPCGCAHRDHIKPGS